MKSVKEMIKMKMLNALTAMLSAFCVMADVTFTVQNVESHQRYPWNGKVDIDFQIVSSDANADFKVSVECTDHDGNTNIVMNTIRLDDSGSAAKTFMLKAGTYRLTWDADVDIPNQKLRSVSFGVFANLVGATDTAEYLIIDLSGGSTATSYPVTTRTGVPTGGWTDEYKTTKLVLRRCSAGRDPLDRYTLTKDFYAGVFEVTQKQWYQVMGSSVPDAWPKYGLGDTYPVGIVSYNDIRGSNSGSSWPSSSAVDSTSFIGILRTKTGLSELDLPTDAQWEYACRAGTTTTYNTGDGEAALAVAGWYLGNSDDTTHPVGQKTANAWGLYDMHGNVHEWCLDWDNGVLSGNDPGGAASSSYRIMRGGCFRYSAENASSSWNYDVAPPGTKYASNHNYGFRLFRTIP